MASHVRAAYIFFSLVSAAAYAADVCPAPPKFTYTRPPDIAADDHRIHIESNDALLGADGSAVLNGRVTVTQDERSVSADSVTYDYNTDRLNVKGKVDFLDPKLRVRSDDGSYETAGGANFNEAFFQLMNRNGRGFAKDVDVSPDGQVTLNLVHYTSCPVGIEDWSLSASKISLDTKLQEGVARNVTMRFKNVPVFYTPYISFPLGDERKSGLLFPSFGHSGSNGFDAQVPYYFNLAPNYDLTLTPGVLTARGVELSEDFRYLTSTSRGQLDATFLPNDKQQHDNRSYLRYTDVTDIRHGLRFDADIATVSDSDYFQSFAVGTEQTSVTFLERRADLLYYDDVWRIRGMLQNFQTIDLSVSDYDRPYSRVPAVQASAIYPIANSNFEFALDSEAVNFLRVINPSQFDASLNNPTGVRLNLSPEIRWSSRGRGYFFEPAIGYDFTQYDLQDAGAGRPSTPTRSLPYARVDAGLVFERDAGSQGQRTQTLEPRLVYSFVPYRNQDRLPIFDSGLPDLNLTELFRTNRYVGSDRVGDANQVALAVTTRLFDTVTGTQYLSATIGQIRYFSIPRVGLPPDPAVATGQIGQNIPIVNPLELPGDALLVARGQPFLAYYPGQYAYGLNRNGFVQPLGFSSQTLGAFPASDIVAEVALTGYKHLGVNLDYQWNPYTSQTEKSEISVQYRPDSSRVINIGYRFQEGILKQWDGSFAWPIAEHWNAVGRWVYSLQDRQTIEQVAGFEYKSCCYKVQLVQRRYLSIRPGSITAGGTLDTSIALQLELTGLSSVGKREDSFLEQSIRGYSTRDPSAQ
ncbi:MAG TPA: LPS assembly protein LptD [Steroidobacteraceae bacterium]|jgi:LPS-assembly protein|nr:LPS assembly protein LptD [Steroidobacteraceae bacterium]